MSGGAELIPKVEIRFGSSWVTVTDDLVSGSIRRGRQRELSSFQAGTLDLTLENFKGQYSPRNTTGLYAPNVKAMCPVRVSGVRADGTSSVQYTGFIEEWPQSWGQIGLTGTVALRCIDATERLSRLALSNVSFPQQTAAARVTAVLTAAGLTAEEMDVQAGGVTLQAVSGVTGSVLDLAMVAATAELGSLFVARDGRVTFRTRALFGAASTVTFGDGPLETNYAMGSVAVGHTVRDVTNLYRVTQEGGSTLVAEDTRSRDAYYSRSEEFTTPLASMSELGAVGAYLLAATAQPRDRVPGVVIDPWNDETAAVTATTVDISSVATFIRRPETSPTITVAAIVEGLSHDFSPAAWSTGYFLSPAPTGPPSYAGIQAVTTPDTYTARQSRFPLYSDTIAHRS